MIRIEGETAGAVLAGVVIALLVTAVRCHLFRNSAQLPLLVWARRPVALLGVFVFLLVWTVIALGVVPLLVEVRTWQVIWAMLLPLGFKLVRDTLTKARVPAIPGLSQVAQLLDELTTTSFERAISEARAFFSGTRGNSPKEKAAVAILYHKHLAQVVRGSLERRRTAELEVLRRDKRKRDGLPQNGWHRVRDTQAQIRYLLKFALGAGEFDEQYKGLCGQREPLLEPVPEPVDISSVIEEILHDRISR